VVLHKMSENTSSKGGSMAKIVAVFAAVAVAIFFIIRLGKAKASTAPPMAGGPDVNKYVHPDDVTAGGMIAQPTSNFAWVDANDRGGAQQIAVVGFIQLRWGGRTVISQTNVANGAIDWRPNAKYSLQVAASLTDAAKKPLSGWGVNFIVFDTHGNKIAEQAADTNAIGTASAHFEITPKNAGVYRIRAAAGDAVDEQGMEFVMPSSLSMSQALGS
jgi:hypothetical protein